MPASPLKVLENIVRNHGLVAVQTHLDDTDYNDAIEAIAAARSRPWEPHLDYAGEPMQPGEFRDPPQVSA